MQIMQEMSSLLKEIPPKWEASVANTGKFIAFYDRSQQERNKVANFPENKKESLIV